MVWRNKLHFETRFQAAYPFIALICKWLGEMLFAVVNCFLRRCEHCAARNERKWLNKSSTVVRSNLLTLPT